MKVRLAFAAAVLALGVTAFTPTPAAAAQPSGILFCQLGNGNGQDLIPFGPPTLECITIILGTVGQAVQERFSRGGHPVGVVIA